MSPVAQDVVVVDVGKNDQPLFTSEPLALDASRTAPEMGADLPGQ